MLEWCWLGLVNWSKLINKKVKKTMRMTMRMTMMIKTMTAMIVMIMMRTRMREWENKGENENDNDNEEMWRDERKREARECVNQKDVVLWSITFFAIPFFPLINIYIQMFYHFILAFLSSISKLKHIFLFIIFAFFTKNVKALRW